MQDKWNELRRRSQQMVKTRDENTGFSQSQVIDSLIKFKPKKTLFGQSFGGLSKEEQAYVYVGTAIRKWIDRQPIDVSISDLIVFFRMHYNHIEGKQCIDYNYWNAQNTFKNVVAELNITYQELAYLLAKWFITYYQLGYDKSVEQSFCLASLKRMWVIHGLYEDLPANRKKTSYY